jgi:ElaB/YqjD/DUF883 family membrane-anchored ribosome-binding protein
MPEDGENGGQQAEQVQPGQQPATGDGDEENLGDAGKQALDRMKAERNEATRALKAAQRELEETRKASMSEAEKAVAEAETRGRTAAMADFGKRLVKSELATAAARRNPDFDAATLDYLDLSRFVGEDGEPDPKAISAAVERLVPAPSGAPSFDGGARRTPPATGDMNSIIRKAAGLG